MLRRVEIDGAPIATTAEAFGFSRPTVLSGAGRVCAGRLARPAAAEARATAGRTSCAPTCSPLCSTVGPPMATSARGLAARVQERFGIAIHPRSIERAWRRRGKKTPLIGRGAIAAADVRDQVRGLAAGALLQGTRIRSSGSVCSSAAASRPGSASRCRHCRRRGATPHPAPCRRPAGAAGTPGRPAAGVDADGAQHPVLRRCRHDESAMSPRRSRRAICGARRISTSASPRSGRCWRTPRVRSGSMPCASAPWPWAGRSSRSSSSIATSGQSGASAADREGFQRLVTEVSLGRAGLVMGLEVSRLARNSTDWHRLLEICALTDTLILDEDGLYDPAHFNDRLLLGLKGTMSEAELHVLRARLRGGILNKARRGELETPLPIGFVYDAARRGGPGSRPAGPAGTMRTLLRHVSPHRIGHGDGQGLPRAAAAVSPPRAARARTRASRAGASSSTASALRILHNPRYAGRVLLRSHAQRTARGRAHVFERLPREQWTASFPMRMPGYISWDDFEANQRRLRENAQAVRARSPAQSAARRSGAAARPRRLRTSAATG